MAVFKTLFGFSFTENDCVNIQLLHLVFSTRSLQCSLLSRHQVGEYERQVDSKEGWIITRAKTCQRTHTKVQQSIWLSRQLMLLHPYNLQFSTISI
jgi:hypothetical protein